MEVKINGAAVYEFQMLLVLFLQLYFLHPNHFSIIKRSLGFPAWRRQWALVLNGTWRT